jgi:hypothetical protein
MTEPKPKPEFLGYVDCHICSSRKVRVTLGLKGILTCTCNGMCKSQTFVRGEGGALVLKQRIRAVPVMPEPAPGMAIEVPGVVQAAPLATPEKQAEPEQEPVKQKSNWDIY